MDNRWLRGAKTAQDKEDRRKLYEQSAYLREELSKILEFEIQESAPDYDLASWSHKQADLNGANRMVRSLMKLLK